MLDTLFSFEGRMNRKPFWLGLLGLFGAAIGYVIVVSLIIGGIFGIAQLPADQFQAFFKAKSAVPFAVIFAALVWPLAAITVKRLKDRGRPVWLVVPMIGLTIGHDILSVLMGWPSLTELSLKMPVLLALELLSHAASLWCLVELGILAGVAGANAHGPDPVAAGRPVAA